MYFVFLYNNRTMKPVDIIIRRRKVMRENNGGVYSNYDEL
jgi:hypothetical protein